MKYAGALCNDHESNVEMTNVIFSSNSANGDNLVYGGGAVLNKGSMQINGISLFKYNECKGKSGGAIVNVQNNGRGEGIIINGFTEFIQNISYQNGGAIYNYAETEKSTATVTISSGANFEKNNAINGGAIYNDNSKGKNINEAIINLISNDNEINFISNNATIKGGAVYNEKGTVNLIANTNDINFTSNTAKQDSNNTKGGAIYNNVGIINLVANDCNITFENNTANKVSNAIHDNGGIINLWAGNKSIIFNDRITSEDDTSILNINPIIASVKDSSGTGNIILNEDMSDWKGTVNLYSGNLEITEDKNFFNGNFTIHGGTLKANANSIITGFTNNGTVNLVGGTIGSKITGTGTTVINGQVTNSSTVANSVTINSEKQLTTNASNVTGNILNSGILELTGGSIGSEIIGTGTTIINGQVTNSSTVANSVTINSEKQLTTNASNVTGNISNSGTLELTGGSISSEITGTGTTVINGEVTNDANIIQSTMIITSGKFKHDNATIISTNIIVNTNTELFAHSEIKLEEYTKIINKGLVEVNVENCSQEDAIKNKGSIEGNGKVVISNVGFVNLNTIKQGTITIENSKFTNEQTLEVLEMNMSTFTNKNSIEITTLNNFGEIINKSILVSTTIINNGTIINDDGATIDADIIKNEGDITSNAKGISAAIENNGTYSITGGTINKSITGTGTTIINGQVTNSSTVANSVTINSEKKLITNASNVTGNILNSGTLELTGGSICNEITGTGTTIINGQVTNSSTVANSVTINSEKQLTTNASNVTGNILNSGTLELTGGSIGSEITGTGTTVINGQVTNSSTVANSVTINSEKQLTTNASNIGNILNSGTLELTGGSISSEITGTGTTIINGQVTNSTKITQSTITVNNSFTNKSIINSTKFYINGTVINEAQIISNDMYINGRFKIGETGNFYSAANSIVSDGAEIFLQNDLLQKHNLGNVTINSGKANLFVDADLENKQMDTISADSFNGNGKIYVKAINIIKDSEEEITEVLFTSSTALKDKIISVDTVNSALYKYNLVYNKETGSFNFINTNKTAHVIAESVVAATTGGAAIQTNIMEQAFINMEGQISKVKNSTSAKSSKLYASAADQVFEENGKIEKGLWLRPFALKETVKLNGVDVDNTLYGTLAGIDLPVGHDKRISFYLGYAGSKQEYEKIKVTQTGYVIGATGMLIKDSWYAGLTANVLFNKAESQSNYGTDDFDMNMYSVGAKAGYNYDINEKWTLEPNLTLMYGNINSKEYETSQGAKIDSQSNSNIIVEPQIKAKLSLINGWQPYALLGYVANMNDKAEVTANGTKFKFDSIDGYVEYGLGVNKEFTNTPWNFYAQVTGRNGGRCGFGGNLGIKYKF